jgi:hypothetical protein
MSYLPGVIMVKVSAGSIAFGDGNSTGMKMDGFLRNGETGLKCVENGFRF